MRKSVWSDGTAGCTGYPRVIPEYHFHTFEVTHPDSGQDRQLLPGGLPELSALLTRFQVRVTLTFSSLLSALRPPSTLRNKNPRSQRTHSSIQAKMIGQKTTWKDRVFQRPKCVLSVSSHPLCNGFHTESWKTHGDVSGRLEEPGTPPLPALRRQLCSFQACFFIHLHSILLEGLYS